MNYQIAFIIEKEGKYFKMLASNSKFQHFSGLHILCQRWIQQTRKEQYFSDFSRKQDVDFLFQMSSLDIWNLDLWGKKNMFLHFVF